MELLLLFMQEPAEGFVEDVADAAQAFDAMDWLTRVLLVIAICWLGWVYRAALGRLIPGGKKTT